MYLRRGGVNEFEFNFPGAKPLKTKYFGALNNIIYHGYHMYMVTQKKVLA